MKRLTALVFILAIFMISGNTSLGKELDLQRDKPIPAKVLEIIESNVYKLMVFDSNTPRIETYRLIGVKSNGNQMAYDYSIKKLLNQTVYFLEDTNIPLQNGIRHCYLYVDFSVSHNEDLIQKGYAEVDAAYQSAKDYLKYTRSQKLVKELSQGIYNFSDKDNGGRILNINTASAEQMSVHFGVDVYKASSWRARIAGNPINHLFELRALDKDFFTQETILEYAPSIHLRTNLQDALPYEIASLTAGLADNGFITDQILKHRFHHDITGVDELNKINILPAHRNAIKPYLTFTNHYYNFSGEEKIVNVNTASAEQIVSALQTNLSQAVILRDYKKTHSYPLRNVEELFKVYFPLNSQALAMDRMSDNIHLYTDVNSAGEFEIRSLFGKISITEYQLGNVVKEIVKHRPFADFSAFEKTVGRTYASQMKEFVYFNTLPETDLLNVNTAGKDKIAKGLNLTVNQKNQLNKRYLSPKELPEFLNKHLDKITLYTNVNRAGYEELLALTPEMTSALAKDIIEGRLGDGYYTLSDVQTIFKKHHLEEVYHRIKNYLILR